MTSKTSFFLCSIAVFAIPLSLIGCATPLTSDRYNATEARVMAEVSFGKIVTISAVSLNGSNSGLGASGGAGLGTIAGSLNGTGIKSVASAAAGGILGTMLGTATEELSTRKTGEELIIQLESGRVIAVVQQRSKTPYRVGQRVRVMTMGSTTRVSVDETTLLNP